MDSLRRTWNPRIFWILENCNQWVYRYSMVMYQCMVLIVSHPETGLSSSGVLRWMAGADAPIEPAFRLHIAHRIAGNRTENVKAQAQTCGLCLLKYVTSRWLWCRKPFSLSLRWLPLVRGLCLHVLRSIPQDRPGIHWSTMMASTSLRTQIQAGRMKQGNRSLYARSITMYYSYHDRYQSVPQAFSGVVSVVSSCVLEYLSPRERSGRVDGRNCQVGEAASWLHMVGQSSYGGCFEFFV